MNNLFKSRIVGKNRTKYIFYMTSLGFPWWIYAPQILYIYVKGYGVFVYDFKKQILQNDNPAILLSAVSEIVDDMDTYAQKYNTVGGIGNSLGSYFIHGYGLKYPIPSIVLNGGGSIVDMIYQDRKTYFLNIRDKYTLEGITKDTLRRLWHDIDSPEQVSHTKAKKVLIFRTINDEIIPKSCTDNLINAYKKNVKDFELVEGNKSHMLSTYLFSWRLKKILNTFR